MHSQKEVLTGWLVVHYKNNSLNKHSGLLPQLSIFLFLCDHRGRPNPSRLTLTRSPAQLGQNSGHLGTGAHGVVLGQPAGVRFCQPLELCRVESSNGP